MKKILCFALACAVLCCACKEEKKTSIEGNSWKLIELYGDNNPAFLAAGTFYVSLDSETKQLTGVGACNRIFGNYKLFGKDGIGIEDMGVTRMMCPNIDLEQQFVTTLGNATRYLLKGDWLVLMNDVEQLATLKRIDPDAAGIDAGNCEACEAHKAEAGEAAEAAPDFNGQQPVIKLDDLNLR